jgi:hypothetical protein
MKWTSISANAFVLAFKLQNADTSAISVDIAVTNDAHLQNDSPRVGMIGSSQGFVVASNVYAVSFICRMNALVTDVSTYWYGYYSDKSSNNWTQTTADSYTGDSAFAFSWQSISIPPLGNTTRSIIVKFGTFDPGVVMLTLQMLSLPSPFSADGNVSVIGFISSLNISDIVRLVGVIDQDTTQIFFGGSYSIDASFLYSFSPADYGVYVGRHDFTFCGVNAMGSISNAVTFTLDLIFATPVKSLLAIATPQPSLTPAATPTPHVTVRTATSPSASPSASVIRWASSTRFASRSPVGEWTSTPSASSTISATVADSEIIARSIEPSELLPTGNMAVSGKVGFIVGVSVGVTLLIVVGVVARLICFCRRRSAQKVVLTSQNDEGMGSKLIEKFWEASDTLI